MIGTYLFYVGIRLDDTDKAIETQTHKNKQKKDYEQRLALVQGTGAQWYARQLRPFQAYWTYTFGQLTQGLQRKSNRNIPRLKRSTSNHTLGVRRGRRCKTARVVKLRGPLLEALKLTLNSVLDHPLASASLTV